jgi:hypothetical protein
LHQRGRRGVPRPVAIAPCSSAIVSVQANAGFDRIAAVCAALVIVALVVFLLIRNEEIANARLFSPSRHSLGSMAGPL